ncbi:hypothetical protein [Actinacidiphila soli]|uniref:hypothetical protein n=1 Tax=Actinacidiphila soli TaxID=2487275 RepID=UPI0013E32F56|nr:hypothetical protein [Actinacidiphila soli]
MVTSMDPEGPKYWFFATGASIRRTPSTYTTVACSAAFTSRRALTTWVLGGKENTDPQSWFDAPVTFARLFDELDRRLAGVEPLPNA